MSKKICKTRGLFTILYPIGFDCDSEKILDYAIEGQKVVEGFFPDELDLDQNVQLFMYEKPSDYDGELDWCYMRADYRNRVIHFNSPSNAYRYNSFFDVVWYKANLIHEYIHIVVARFIEKNTGKDMQNDFPRWFYEGIAGYIPYYFSSEDIIKKYKPRLKNVIESIQEGEDDFEAIKRIEYYGEAIIVQYLFEAYGISSVINFMKNTSEEWKTAIEESLGITYLDFTRKWKIFARKLS